MKVATVTDHNAARWLVVRRLGEDKKLRHRQQDECWRAGWYVMRVCPCCWGERVLRYPLDSEAEARQAMAAMVHASEALGIDL